jgi:hypothetical protein
MSSITTPFHAIEREAQHLHDLEQAGESEWTPWIALLGLVLLFATVIALVTALVVTAYALAR